MDPKTLKGGKPVAWASPGLSAGIGTEIGLACHRRFMADTPEGPRRTAGDPDRHLPRRRRHHPARPDDGRDGRGAAAARRQDAGPHGREGRRPRRRGRAARRPARRREGLGAGGDRRRHRQALGRQGLQAARRRALHPARLHDLRRRRGDGARPHPGRLPGGQGDALGDLRGRARRLRHRAPDRGPLVHPRADEPLVRGDDPLALPQQAGAGEGRIAPPICPTRRCGSSASSAPG